MTSRARHAGIWLGALTCLLVCAGTARAYDWLPPTNKIALLAVWAHPDDEGIWGGGSLPYYSSVLHMPTMIVCMCPSEAVRYDELRCAAWSYGLRYEPVFGDFMGYNSGLNTNTAFGTNTINLTWDYWADGRYQGTMSEVEAGKARAINFVAEQIRRYRPDVVITHDLNGETGHDNHKATAYAVTQAFSVAADPNATATNLVGLPPWQAQKLYVHLYPSNRLFHTYWETPSASLSNQTPHQAVNVGLTCHVSQGSNRWICASVYPPSGSYTTWPSEWWGLYASVVGPDTVLTSNLVVRGYAVPAGVAVGGFFEHVALDASYQPPAFANPTFTLASADTYDPCVGQTLADYVVASTSLQALTFSKVSGPAWLNVAPDGTLSGVSSSADAGMNTWVVSVSDGVGPPVQATMSMFLIARAPAADNLVGWWKLNQTNPSPYMAINSSPLSPCGVWYGGVTFGRDGAQPWTRWAAQFNGADAKIDVPYVAALNPPVFTAALWANVTGGSGAYRSPLTSRRATPQSGYVFYAGPNNVWQFWIGNGSAWTALSGAPVVTNTWMHLAATYDGAKARFYTNGILAASVTVAFRPNDAFPLRIGAGATEGNGSFWFPGLIDDVRVYRVALDALHIRALCAPPPALGNLRVMSDRTIQVEGSGVAGLSYVLLSADNRLPGTPWTPVATNLADQNGQLLFLDPGVGSDSTRFYRLIMP